MRSYPFAAMFAAIVSLASTSAFAVTVNFTTKGAFGANSPTSVAVLAGPHSKITYTGETAGHVETEADMGWTSFAHLGTFTVTASSLADTYNAIFTLEIDQTTPGVGSAMSVATLQGKIKKSSSGLFINFAPGTTITIGGVVYEPFVTTNLVPPTTGGGVTTLQGQVTAVPVPVPASVLGGGALLGLLALVKLRRLAAARV